MWMSKLRTEMAIEEKKDQNFEENANGDNTQTDIPLTERSHE